MCVTRRINTAVAARFEGAASFSGFTSGAIYATYEPIYDNLKFVEAPHFERNSVSRRPNYVFMSALSVARLGSMGQYCTYVLRGMGFKWAEEEL